MEKKSLRQKHFALKELRYSIAHMVLWALLSVAFFTYMAVMVGEKVERDAFYFVIVFIGYAIIVFSLTWLFTHRFLGPFERLKIELKLILAGDYSRRLSVRGRDDMYIRSFISEVDKVIDRLEKMRRSREELISHVSPELLQMKTLLEKKDIPIDPLKEAFARLNEKFEGFLKKH
ncbi:MAG: methyl-accepting chemotaxis protein [Nitrospirae bacterium]|nr:methyl-accepting chemotaxis protein [Nitrospirota bacterium]